jgi:tetratricopeptide (TPR) repeat protein
LAGTYLGIWLAFLILNAVTIDNLGVGIWLWIFAGIIIARSAIDKDQDNAPPSSRTAKKNSKSSANISIAPSINSLILVTVALAICVPLTTNSLRLSELGYYARTLEKDALAKKLISYADEHSSDPQTLTVLGRYAIEKQDGETMLYLSEKISKIDSRSYMASYFPAIVYEAMNKRNQAIPYREKLLKIDRWSTSNMLQLIRTYYENKEYGKVREMAAKLKELYPESEDSKKAQTLLKTLPNK